MGSQDQKGTENTKDLQRFLGNGSFMPGQIQTAARARVIVFQTWIGAHGDRQLLVGLTDGRLFSIDHGDCFGNPDDTRDPTVVVTAIPGVRDDLGKDARYVRDEVSRVEGITNRDLLAAVSAMPEGGTWGSDPDRRLRIAQWLAHRRNRLREVMEEWLRS